MRCTAESTVWKQRSAVRLANGIVEIVVLTGGGHIADFRLCGSPDNTIWEAPWPTLDPEAFSPQTHSPLYGEGPVGRFLAGYTGHALAIPFYGMPDPTACARGVALHGEAACGTWRVARIDADAHAAIAAFEVSLPVSGLQFRREVTLARGSSAVEVHETVFNPSDHARDFQWVQHAAFGEPFLARGEASVYLNASRGLTWPLGYEGHELLPSNTELDWPYAPTNAGGTVDLREPFLEPSTGLVACFLVTANDDHGFIAVHNRRLAIAAGYVFERARFPWIAVWEENCARPYAPWNGSTRVRGLEFGTSPMPLGLDQARATKMLWNTPVVATLPPHSQAETLYRMFVAAAPRGWSGITAIQESANGLDVRGDNGETLRVSY